MLKIIATDYEVDTEELESLLTKILKETPKQRRTRAYIKGVFYSFEPNLWLDYTDIIVRLEADIAAIRWAVWESEKNEPNTKLRQQMAMNMLQRFNDIQSFRKRVCEFMKVGDS